MRFKLYRSSNTSNFNRKSCTNIKQKDFVDLDLDSDECLCLQKKYIVY